MLATRPLLLVILAGLTAFALGGCPPTGNGNNNDNDNGGGEGLTTGFEFTDTSGEFTLGTEPRRVTFAGGEANTVGIPELYHSGHRTWLIASGDTGEITFETPTFELEFFVRDQGPNTDGVVTLFNEEGEELEAVESTDAGWTMVVWPGDIDINDRVARVTVENTGTSGLVSLDDFSCCGDHTGGNGDGELPDPIDDPVPDGIAASDFQVRLTTVAVDLTAPNWGASPPGQPTRLAVSDQPGVLWMIDLTTGAKTTFLDVSDRLVELGISGPGSFDERGLLGFAFDPEYAATGLLYTYTSEPVSGPADFSTMATGETADHQSVILEWRVPDPTNSASVVDAASVRELLRFDEPQFNHNGGAMNFGPDGMLYIAIGDGGAADDEGPGHGETGNGQNPATVLGKLLRIDPAGNNAANGHYGIPANNPLVDEPGFLDEIYAYGLRNPFRFSFDSQTGQLWLADVGQNALEEINIVEPGGNYGWDVKEGSFFFYGNGAGDGFVSDVAPADLPSNLQEPIAEYDHDEGIAVIGGFVYHGTTIAGLEGRYVFGELLGRLFHIDAQGLVRELDISLDFPAGASILGFGQDGNGELYLMINLTGVPFETTGMVFRIDPPAAGG